MSYRKGRLLLTVPAMMRNQPVHSSSAIYSFLQRHLTPARQMDEKDQEQTEDGNYLPEKKKEATLRNVQGHCRCEASSLWTDICTCTCECIRTTTHERLQRIGMWSRGSSPNSDLRKVKLIPCSCTDTNTCPPWMVPRIVRVQHNDLNELKKCLLLFSIFACLRLCKWQKWE